MTNFLSITAAIAIVPGTNWIGAGVTNIGGTNYWCHHPQAATNHWIIFVAGDQLNQQVFRCDVGTIRSNEVRLIPQ
jgi:hypothetical protein